MEAQQWCDNFDNRKELAEICTKLLQSFSRHPCRTIPGQKYDMGDGRVIDDKSMAAYYWKDEKVASLILQEPRSLVPDRKRSLGLCLEIR